MQGEGDTLEHPTNSLGFRVNTARTHLAEPRCQAEGHAAGVTGRAAGHGGSPFIKPQTPAGFLRPGAARPSAPAPHGRRQRRQGGSASPGTLPAPAERVPLRGAPSPAPTHTHLAEWCRGGQDMRQDRRTAGRTDGAVCAVTWQHRSSRPVSACPGLRRHSPRPEPPLLGHLLLATSCPGQRALGHLRPTVPRETPSLGTFPWATSSVPPSLGNHLLPWTASTGSSPPRCCPPLALLPPWVTPSLVLLLL